MRDIIKLAHTLTLAIAGTFAAVAAQAQTAFPNKAVRIIVTFAPGGSADASARVLAEQLSTKWKQPVIIENKPGAFTALGAAHVAKAPADGYTILYAAASFGTLNLFVKNPGFDPQKDLIPVTQVISGDLVLSVRNDLPVNTIGEFADYARKNAGKVFHGSFGGGARFAFELLGERLKFQVTDVPYKGESPAIAALMGGDIHAVLSSLSAARPFIESGKIKALGLMSKSRSPIAPDIKSADESDTKGVYHNLWFGLLVPNGTSPEVIKAINADVGEVLARSDVKGRYYGMGLTATPTTPEQFGKVIKHESERWVGIAKRIGIEPQ